VSAYLDFAAEVRQQVKDDNPTFGGNEIRDEVTRMWYVIGSDVFLVAKRKAHGSDIIHLSLFSFCCSRNELTAEEKQPYYDHAKQKMEEWKSERSEWVKEHPQEPKERQKKRKRHPFFLFFLFCLFFLFFLFFLTVFVLLPSIQNNHREVIHRRPD
jgi:hypothetical protein